MNPDRRRPARPALAVAALWACLASAAAAALPTPAQVRAAHRPSDLPLLDRHGQPLQTLRVDDQARRLAWVPLADLSPALLAALVHSEDRRFWAHSGVDWAALARSAWETAFNQRTRGGSTLTMQLAGLLDTDLARPADGRSVGQKLGQLATAQALEAGWRKSEILEAYLNLVPLRGEAVGVNAGAQALFGKHPSGLDETEAALLAALVRAPNAAPARVAERACALRLSLADQPADAAAVARALPAGAGPCAGLGLRAEAALARRAGPPLGEQVAPHAARQVWRQWRTAAPAQAPLPQALASTLHAPVQRLARQALRHQLAELRQREVDDGAVVVLDNASGEVLAWVGSAGDGAPAVDAVLARRQPGSTLKPFVYALAFERGLLTPGSLLHDAPAQLAAGGGLYLPQNYDHRHHGWVSARQALASSLNIPAVRVGALAGPEALFEHLNLWGLRLSHDAGHHGHALALGSAEVTLIDLANAYRALAQGGRWSPWRLVPGAPAGEPARRVVRPGTAWQVADILADNTARAPGFGLDSPLVTRGWAAVKTGTSKDMRDNWCVGVTQRYTVAVWVGNASGAPMQRVSGVTGAAPVWRELVQALHAQQPSQAPVAPPGLATLASGPASRVAPPAAGGAAYGIRSPLPGSVFALDPDMPPQAQRIVFDGPPGRWWLDGQALPPAEGRVPGAPATLYAWAPWPGRHRLELRDTDGRTLAPPVAFEVRGARVDRPGARPAVPAQRP